MRTYASQLIRAVLRNNLDGMTVHAIADHLDMKPPSIRKRLTDMPDTYIDRWTHYGVKGMPSAVWCVVVPPANCPRPDPKRAVKVKRTDESRPYQ